MLHYQTEAVVVGGGLAGLVAALELLDAGRDVLILDRDAPAAFGGLARESFGGMFFVKTPEQRLIGARDSVELAWEDWQAFAEFGPEDEWPRRWARHYIESCRPQVYDWLRARGIGFFPVPHWVERGQFQSGNSVPRFHLVWGTGEFLVDTLIRRLEAHPNRKRLTLKFGHRVEHLVQSAGAVSGCAGVLEESGEPFDASGNCVLVASGGMNGDLEQVRRHWHPDWSRPPEVILSGSHRFADGRLHGAVEELGGRITHLDKMWNYAAGVHHYRPKKPNHGLSLVPPRSALWLSWRGERLGPQPLVTGFDTRELVTRICREERAYSWQVLNWKIAVKELAVSGAEFNPSVRDRKWLAFLRDILLGNRWLVEELTSQCSDFVVANSLPELVEKMNALQGDGAVSLPTVADVIARYDAQIERGNRFQNDEQLRRIAHVRRYPGDRVRTCRSQQILDRRAMPLIAIREFIISRKSLGGIQTDLRSRVLDEPGQPIPGLYAAGEAAGFGGGGMHGLRALEGAFLGGCVLTGREAGRAMAGRPAL
jgi:uncharacterized protein